jgi:hypothetical protein
MFSTRQELNFCVYYRPNLDDFQCWNGEEAWELSNKAFFFFGFPGALDRKVLSVTHHQVLSTFHGSGG